MRGAAKCCVPNCDSNKTANPDLTFLGFPKDLGRCKQWLKVVGNEDLVYLLPRTLTNSRFVCSVHFSREQYSKRTRKTLSRSAIPDQFEDDVCPLTATVLENFPPREVSTILKSSFVELDALQTNQLSKFPIKPIHS